jgi:hypothetical protein
MQLQKSGLNWQLNWNKTNAGRDYANVGGVQFKCMPQKCTKGICRGTPDNLVDECFLTRDGDYKRLNGAVCPFCPAGQGRVNTGGGDFACVEDKCNNILDVQTTIPAGTTRNGAGACIGATVPTTTQCSDGIDNDTDAKVDYPADPGCSSATDTSEDDTVLTQCIASGGTILADPDCTSASDNDERSSIPVGNVTFPFCLPACLDGQPCTSPCGLTCPAGETKKVTPNSPVCFLALTPSTSPAGTSLTLTGYDNLMGNCTLASSATNTVPASPILPSGASTGLVVSPTVSSVVATTAATFTTTAQAVSLLTCPAGAPTCSIGAGGVISCGCYNAGITPPAVVTAAAFTCVSDLCTEGQYFCSAEDKCKPAKESCSTITCDNDATCEVGESCNCGDCTNGGDDDKDKC